MNNEHDYDAPLTYAQIADSIMNTEQAMATEDNYTMPNRTIAEYLELGYTISYAKSLVSRAEAEQEAREREYIMRDYSNTAKQNRINVLTAIDELNQYLLGNVTIEAATDAARELTHKLNESW